MIYSALLLISLSFASIPKHSKIHEVLRESPEKRLSYFKNEGATLRSIAFSDKESFRYRWSAFSTLMKLKSEKKDLLRALKSEDWFLRDLGLKVAKEQFPDIAVAWSKKLIKDPSLIVRTTAVKNLDSLGDANSLDLLWQELYSKQNFRNKRSLWIRRHIVRALGNIAKKDIQRKQLWSKRLAKVLLDEDSRLHTEAIYALANWYPSGPRINVKEPLEIQKEKWLSWTRKFALF